MKCLAILGAVLALVPVGASVSQTAPANASDRRIGAKHIGKVEGQQVDPQQANPVVAPSVPVVNQTVPARPNQAITPDEIEQTQNETRSFLKPEWVSVEVTLVYTIFTGLTLLVIKRQADIMADQLADARKESDDATRTTNETLAAIKRQADSLDKQAVHMANQTAILERSVSAAIEQIEMVKSKERAQLRVEFAQPDFAYDAESKAYPVNFQITLDGTTRAYIFEDSILVYLSKSKRTGTTRRGFGMPRNMIPDNSPYDGKTLIYNTAVFPEPETDMNKFYYARRGEEGYTLFADGTIWYADIFGDQWILEIDRYWDTAVGMWGPVGSGRNDTHRKVEKFKSPEIEKAN